MKVQDIMNVDVEYVTADTTVREVSRIIFGRGINGVPVVDKKQKLVGFITEKDILAKFFPTVQEHMEDPVNTRDFEAMEGRIKEVFSLPAEKIMTHNLKTVSADTPVLRAYSLMTTQKIGRLPVANKDGKLRGIVSKGDIFRSVVAGKIPYAEDEEYHDWLSHHYDQVVQWGQRLSHELPDLIGLFSKNKVKKVLDVGSGTGEHDIALAKKGFDVDALERSVLMWETSQEKKNKLSGNIKKNVQFIRGDYVDILEMQRETYDAAIFMGNALPHNPNDYKKILLSVYNSLHKGSVLVLQIANLNKILKVNKRIQDFNVGPSKVGKGKEMAFLEFFDPPRAEGGPATLNMAILGFDGRKWAPKAINSTPIAYFTQGNLVDLLKKTGFKKVEVYGSMLLGHLFKERFDPIKSDWLNIIAKR